MSNTYEAVARDRAQCHSTPPTVRWWGADLVCSKLFHHYLYFLLWGLCSLW